MIFLILAPIFIAAYLLALRGRKYHPQMEALRNSAYAHRGLHGNGIPENSMAAFRAAMEGGYGIELDVHLMRDGRLAVIHDTSLKRTAGADIRIEDLTAAELANYPLDGTKETIPLLSQVLELNARKAPLIIELKSERNNYAALTKAACDLMDSYQGPYCVESFDPRCIAWLAKHRPDIVRGQLAENFVANPHSPLPLFLKFVLTHQLENFLIRPDFVAYKFSDRKTLGNLLVRKLWGAQGVTWTLKSQKDFDTAVAEGWLPIFEGFRP